MIANRITFDAHTYNDIGVEYAAAGYVPEITDDTLVGDLIFHRGNLSWFRLVTTAETTGANLITGFTNDATFPWSSFPGGGINGDYEIASAIYAIAYQAIELTPGKAYRLSFTGSLVSGEDAFIGFSSNEGGGLWSSKILIEDGACGLTFDASADTKFVFMRNASSTASAFTLADLTLKEVTSPESGNVTFNGFGSISETLADVGLTGSDGGDAYLINTAANHGYFYLWQKSTNLLVSNDSPRVLNLGAEDGSPALLETDIGSPVVWKSGGGDPIPTNGIGSSVYDSINAVTVTVGDYVGLYQAALSNHATSTSGESIKLTTEGPILMAKEFWPIDPALFGGMNANCHYDLEFDESSKVRLTINTDRALAYRLGGDFGGIGESRSGWPSDRLKFHRMFEGPSQTRKYENRGQLYVHLDFNNDPVGPDGCDFTLNDIGALDESDIAFQTCDIETKIEPWGAGIVTTPSYPLTLVNDVSKELDDQVKSGSSLGGFQGALAGDPQIYCRINLLKEHYNDLANALKRCKNIRPLCFDEIYFGNLSPIPSSILNGLFTLSSLSPRDCYAAFHEGSNQHSLYSRLFAGTDYPIRDKSSFPDDIWEHSVWHDQIKIEAYRWVSISDVRARAAELGFKFRYEKQFAVLRYKIDQLVYTNATFDVGTFYPDTYGNWKIPITTPVLSGSDYIATLGSSYVLINAYNYGVGTRLLSASSDANYGILIYLIDTSRTETGPRAKFGTKQIAASSGSVGADSIRELELSEEVVQPSTSEGHYIYLCQVTPPVTHTVDPSEPSGRSITKTAEQAASLKNRQSGLHQIIFKK